MNSKHKVRLPVRPDVTTLTYHRNPTDYEIRFGYGATHWRDFPVESYCHPGTRKAMVHGR